MPRKILIIEDDANLLYGMQAKFNVAGFQAMADAGLSKEDVLNKIKDFKPDFIILDLILPQVDGLELLKKIKANQETSSIPVFVFTNLSDQNSKSRGLDLGADYYFIKDDFSIDEFVGKVKKIIENMKKIGKIEK
ncbi:MAG: response regulator [Patescibacteria group bacterium]|nr:response regulator [Patescibacteria group bacterium]